MTTETKQTGATDAQIEAAANRWNRPDYHPNTRRDVVQQIARVLIPEDMCIVPSAFVAAVDAALSEAEELDYTTPAFRIPIKRWEDVQNARDTFREGTS